MSAGSKKRKPLILFLVIISWFVFFLPGIKIFLNNILSPSYKFNVFEETEDELSNLIQSQNALYPADFISLNSKWESFDTQWSSSWHLYKPFLNASISELENLDSRTFVPPGGSGGGKSKKNSTDQKISNEDFWAIVYNIILDNNKNRLNNLVSAFLWFQTNNELTDRETLEIIIDFIQDIPYEIPDNYYGLYSPVDILFRNAGDCDSKSILASLILKKLGYKTAILYSEKYTHVMLGINILSAGEYLELNGIPYYFTEMTATGWQIGDIPPDCADLKYWHILSI
jgi:hypothetical protein